MASSKAKQCMWFDVPQAFNDFAAATIDNKEKAPKYNDAQAARFTESILFQRTATCSLDKMSKWGDGGGRIEAGTKLKPRSS